MTTVGEPTRFVAPGSSTVSMLSVDDSPSTKLLPFVLSVVAGSVDIIGFLGLGGLFTAHITGNIIVLAAKVVVGESAPVAYLLSVPVFMLVLALTRLLVAGLERVGFASLLPLLLLQFLLLLTFLAICLANGPRIDPNAAVVILAGMLGVSAMAVQNEVTRISIKGAPSTAVMTTNVTLLAIDVGEILFGRDPRALPRRGNGPSTRGRWWSDSCSAARSVPPANRHLACGPWPCRSALPLWRSPSGWRRWGSPNERRAA